MRELYHKIIAIDPNVQALVLIVFFFVCEQVLNAGHRFNNKGRHFANNFVLFVLYGVVTYLIIDGQIWLVKLCNDHQVGLFYLVPFPYTLKVVIGVMLFDMGAYWTHRLSHRLPLFWRLHRVHHSDSNMDSSTYFRFHPFEITFSIASVLVAVLFGLELEIMFLYLFIVFLFVAIEHVNIKFPEWLDKTVGLIITTPNMHKIHHDKVQEFTDSNYADMFILWGRLFGTYKHKDFKDLSYGLDEFNEPGKQSFWFLLKSPFVSMKKGKE
jgi:sterol desaturase/sphingolipid hydroxylase (fatty acid hydroxylase superfamily)